MRTREVAALLVATLIISVSLPLMAGEWQPGMFWRWESVNAQSPSFTNTITIYVLTSTKVLDADVYVLGQVGQINDETFVQLGEAMRQPGGPIQALGVQFQRDTRWRLNPPGWESKESWSWPANGGGTGTTIKRVEADNVDVRVPAGFYPHCMKLFVSYCSKYPDRTIEETDTTWYSRDIDWPVKISDTVTINDKTYQGTTVLMETGMISPEEAAQKILATIDEMPSSDAYFLRRKLLSLGLLNHPSP